MLALGAVPQDKVAATHLFVNAKILPKSMRRSEQTDSRSHRQAWPPPPPPGEHDGMPCGVYVSQFTLQALYKHTADHGQAALELLTSTAKNSWLNMIKQGATASMEAWTVDEKPNLTWRFVTYFSRNHLPAHAITFLASILLYGHQLREPFSSKLLMMLLTTLCWLCALLVSFVAATCGPPRPGL